MPEPYRNPSFPAGRSNINITAARPLDAYGYGGAGNLAARGGQSPFPWKARPTQNVFFFPFKLAVPHTQPEILFFFPVGYRYECVIPNLRYYFVFLFQLDIGVSSVGCEAMLPMLVAFNPHTRSKHLWNNDAIAHINIWGLGSRPWSPCLLLTTHTAVANRHVPKGIIRGGNNA
jgi:hypothetical protein